MDNDFLRDRAYPWFKEVAHFLDQIAVRDDNGLRKLPISSSPEIYNNSREAWFGQTTNFDLGLIRFTYEKAREMAKILGLPDDAERWEKILSEWPEFTVDESGFLFAPGYPYNEPHRHFSHLMAFHPLGLIDWANGKTDQEIIQRTLRNLENNGTDWWVGYSFSWLGNLYARAFEGDNAADVLRTFATCFTLPNSFHVNGDQSGTGKSKFTYRPFTLEGNFAFASGIQEMLIQSHTGVVRLFPAIPGEWKDLNFSGLRAEGAFVISAIMEQGEVKEVKIHSETGDELRLANPFKNDMFLLNGKAVNAEFLKDGIITIQTIPGEKIILIAGD
jgi:alpha-L-fucosidase 2